MTNIPVYWNNYYHSSAIAWARECYNNGACEVTSEDYFKVIYIKIKNGWPTLLTEEIVTSRFNLNSLFNTALTRTWLRNYEEYEYTRGEFWTNCRSISYFGHVSETNSYNREHIKLPNGQEFRIDNTVATVMITSGLQSHVFRHNISDSWVDVALQYRSYVGGSWSFVNKTWRVHGNSPDPWDAPDHIKNSYGTWPPDSDYYRIVECDHTTSNAYGSIQYDNATDIDDVYRTVIPQEIHIVPVKGPPSGYVYLNDDHNIYAYDTVSTEFKELRIENYSTYYRIYFSYGDGKPTIEGSWFVDEVEAQGKWDSRIWGVTIDLHPDGSMTIVNQSVDYLMPSEITDELILDTALNVNKLSARAILPSNVYEVLNTPGIEEFTNIYNAAISDWTDAGYPAEYISVRQQTSLVTKPREI